MTYLREVPFMGVIYVLYEAMKRGFELAGEGSPEPPGVQSAHPGWVNLGQGQPEVGELPGAPERISAVELEPGDHAYGPVSGTRQLRQAVAGHYNTQFRKGRASQYTAANVAIVQGGRLALSRALAALGDVNVGYMLPDYSAYEDMLGLNMSRVTPVPLRTSADDGFRFTATDLSTLINQAGIGAFLMSNPCNPTGALAPLDELIKVARDGGCALLLDEFYSHYVYDGDGPVSGAAYVDDVDKDEVVLFDGLTKNHRYPGWRLGWVVGPAHVIGVLDRVGSALDGGPSQIVQRAALSALEPGRAAQETSAVRAEFRRKRDHMVSALRDMGVRANAPAGTFYVWGCLDELPAPLHTGMGFFRAALEHQVITVPGELFDVNPGRRRKGERTYQQWMRFSFGPSFDAMDEGLSRLAAMVASHR